jgi:hypothetical protein
MLQLATTHQHDGRLAYQLITAQSQPDLLCNDSIAAAMIHLGVCITRAMCNTPAAELAALRRYSPVAL